MPLQLVCKLGVAECDHCACIVQTETRFQHTSDLFTHTDGKKVQVYGDLLLSCNSCIRLRRRSLLLVLDGAFHDQDGVSMLECGLCWRAESCLRAQIRFKQIGSSSRLYTQPFNGSILAQNTTAAASMAWEDSCPQMSNNVIGAHWQPSQAYTNSGLQPDPVAITPLVT